MTNSTNQTASQRPAAPSGAGQLVAEGNVFVFSGTEYKAFRPHFRSSNSAGISGYFSRSHWKRSRREPLPIEKPVLCVAKAWSTFCPKDGDVILGYTLLNNYLVTNPKFFDDIGSLGCWPVFQESETQPFLRSNARSPKASFSKSNKASVIDNSEQPDLQIIDAHETTIGNSKEIINLEVNSSSSLSSSITSSHDGEANAPKEQKPLPANELRQDDSNSRLITTGQNTEGRYKKGSRDIYVYFPEGFGWEDYPELSPYRSSVLWIAHKLHERRFVNADGCIYGPDDFITIKSEHAREIDPNFRHAVKLLLDLDIIERDFYEPGTKSYGYRFADAQLRHAIRRRVPLCDPKLAQRIDRHRKKQVTTRTDRWLHSHLLKIGLAEIDEEFLEQVCRASVAEHGGRKQDKLDCYRFVLERIGRKEHLWSTDDQGRRYSLVTNLKRELRSLLRVEGQQLQQIDIANSQLTFLALKMRSEGFECNEFFGLCESGSLYEHVAKHAKTNRSAVKKAITQCSLFSPNDAACQKSSIKRDFDRLFPEVAAYLKEAKAGLEGHSKLAKALQFAEADFIIDVVCGRLRREDKVGFVTPIHDCVVFLPRDASYVKAVMTDEFAKIGIRPRLEIKPV